MAMFWHDETGSVPGWEIFFPTGMPVLLVCQGGFFCQPPWHTTEEFDNLPCMPGGIFLKHPLHTRGVFYNLPSIPGVIFSTPPSILEGIFTTSVVYQGGFPLLVLSEGIVMHRTSDAYYGRSIRPRMKLKISLKLS